MSKREPFRFTYRSTYQAFFWNVEAKFEEAEKKQVTIRATISPKPGTHGPLQGDDFFYLCRELQYLTALTTASSEATGFPSITLEEDYQPSEIVIPDLNELNITKPYVLMTERFTLDKSMYPADITAWTREFNLRIRGILSELMVVDLTPSA